MAPSACTIFPQCLHYIPPGCGVSDERLAARTLLGHLASPLVRYAGYPLPPLHHPCMHIAALSSRHAPLLEHGYYTYFTYYTH